MRTLFIVVLLLLPCITSAKILQVPKVQETYAGEFQLSRYYSPVKWQKKYYVSRMHDLAMNCWGSEEKCKDTANGHILADEDIGYVYSCPPEIPFDTKIKLVFHWWVQYGICKDRWWDIKKLRLDSWCGYWDTGVNNIKKWIWCYTGKAKIYLLQ